MRHFYFVHDSEGRIGRSGSCSLESDVALQASEPGEFVKTALGRVDGLNCWWDGAAIKPRAPLGATLDKHTVTADGIDEAVLSGLPTPCTVYVDDVPELVEDGSAELSFTTPGTYIVMVNEPAYQQQFWQIEAV